MDSHGRPVCADGHTRTATDVLCMLTDTHGRPPTWAKITRTIHGKGQRAESKNQRTDIYTDGQPRTSCTYCVCWRTHTDVLCVLTDTHGRPVCADGHTRTHMDSHRPTDVLCVLADSHGRPVCTEQTAHVGKNHPNSPRVSVRSPRTNVLICVLMDGHGYPVCAVGHTRTATDVLCILTDTHGRPLLCADGHTRTHTDNHGRPVCADGQPRTFCVCWRTPTDVLCVLNR
ncbi:unnamed protein product [Brassica rapa]|uniref:Uncharacterized protein n=1 Tax=Brassica campestris TaxID=3711 RepID=A0A8D9FZ98_BRACM|nr:unnamed protein product [Brassica rapa]